VNRWARIVLALSAFATLAWIGAGATGWRVVDDSTLARHTLVSFLVLLALVMTHGWVALFVVVSSRLVRRRATIPGEALRQLALARFVSLIAAVAAVVAALALFVMSNALYPARLAARPHALAAAAATAVLVAAWIAELRALDRHGRALSTVEN
jgi:hypothetical protein